MSVNVSGLYGLEDRLERVADELHKRNEIGKLELLKQIERNLSGKDKE